MWRVSSRRRATATSRQSRSGTTSTRKQSKPTTSSLAAPTCRRTRRRKRQPSSGIVQTMKALNFMMLAETRDSIGYPDLLDRQQSDRPALLHQGRLEVHCRATRFGLRRSQRRWPDRAARQAARGVRVGRVDRRARARHRARSPRSTGRWPARRGSSSRTRSPAATQAHIRRPTTPGCPDAGALARADSALTASALYNPSVIAPPSGGQLLARPFGVYHTFSGQSGDLQNAVLAYYYIFDATWDLYYDVDTRRLAVQEQVRGGSVSGPAVAVCWRLQRPQLSPVRDSRAAPSRSCGRRSWRWCGRRSSWGWAISPTRSRSSIRCTCRRAGFATPLSIAPTYTAVRDSLLKEQRISTVFEPSNDRMIALRMYHLEAVADTTWQATAGPDAAHRRGVRQHRLSPNRGQRAARRGHVARRVEFDLPVGLPRGPVGGGAG